MRRRRDEAYVLGTHELGETDLIVTLLAAHHGRVRAVGRSARASRRRFGGCLEPLTQVDAVWVEREGLELGRLEALDCVRSFATMQSAPERQAACAVLAEIARTFSPEGEAEPRGFRLLGSVLEALEAGGDPWTLVRYFEYWTLRLHGLLPDLERCASCGRELGPSAALPPAGGPVCAPCVSVSGGELVRLGPAERAFLARAATTAPGAIGVEPRAARHGGALERLLRRTLESYAERGFRGYRHLRAVSPAPRGVP